MFDYIDYMWVKFFAILLVIAIYKFVEGFITEANKAKARRDTQSAQPYHAEH
jgi:hypothetical protein